MRQSNRKKQKGFTLIELMISMLITVTILGVLIGVTRVAIDAWQVSQDRARTSRIAKEVIDSVGRDLEGMVLRTGNTSEWLSIKKASTTGNKLGPDNGGIKSLRNALEFNFYSAVTDRYNGQINKDGVDLGGDVSLIRITVVHQDQVIDNGDFPVFAIYRERVDPKEAFQEHLGKADITGGKSSTEISKRENYLAENVYDFNITFTFEFTKDNGALEYKKVPISATGKNTTLSMTGNKVLVNGTELTSNSGATNARLSSADITLLVLSDGGMESLKNLPISNDERLAKFLNEYGYTFSKSIVLPRP